MVRTSHARGPSTARGRPWHTSLLHGHLEAPDQLDLAVGRETEGCDVWIDPDPIVADRIPGPGRVQDQPASMLPRGGERGPPQAGRRRAIT